MRRREEDTWREEDKEGEIKSVQYRARRGWQCGGLAQTGPRCSTVSGGEASELRYSRLDLVVIQQAQQDSLKCRWGGGCSTPSGH